MVKAVIFDLDDTLYLERDFVHSGFRSVDTWCRSEYGIAGVGDVAWRLFCEGRRGDIFDAALAELNVLVTEGMIRQLVQAYRTHQPEISLPQESARCLTELRAKYKLGLITDGPSETQWNKIRALNLGGYLDSTIVTADLGTGFSKPHEKAFVNMEAVFAATRAELVYVADNPAKDFVAPRLRGWRTIRVQYDLGIYRKVPAAGGYDRCLPGLSGVPAVVDRL
jgi:putative hydrolase of the HAD superfamily